MRWQGYDSYSLREERFVSLQESKLYLILGSEQLVQVTASNSCLVLTSVQKREIRIVKLRQDSMTLQDRRIATMLRLVLVSPLVIT